MSDPIERQDAIDAIAKYHMDMSLIDYPGMASEDIADYKKTAELILKDVPSAELALYGYKIEHLVYIARVMQKEGVTAEYAVRTFDDISRALRMIIEEAQEKVMEMLNERYDLPTGGD